MIVVPCPHCRKDVQVAAPPYNDPTLRQCPECRGGFFVTLEEFTDKIATVKAE